MNAKNKNKPNARKVINDFIQNLSDGAKEKVKEMYPELFNNETMILESGTPETIMIPRYRDLNPDMTFWVDLSNLGYSWVKQSDEPLDLNIPYDGTMYYLQGKYWKDEWDNDNFKPKVHKDAKWYLVKIVWGGANNSTRGVEWDILSRVARYSKRVRSKNGKCGINYYIFYNAFYYDLQRSTQDLIEKLTEESENDEFYK